jgi:Carboxypeptidase regulatory-like domain
MICRTQGVPPRKIVSAVPGTVLTRLLATVAMMLTVSVCLSAQTPQPAQAQLGRVIGTVMDVNQAPLFGATVVITGPDSADRRSVLTDEKGYFEINGLKPGLPYRLIVSAAGFADWTSSVIVLAPGEFKLMDAITLRVAAQQTVVHVTYNPVQAANEQFKVEEKQRILGIVPNFFVSYEGKNAAPLTTKMKFELALKVSYDPVTVAGVALVAAARQAADTPSYGQGWAAYGKRFGATAADGFTDIMIGGAILPSLLHEDPRYFYQGTGTTKSRIWHAISSPFIGRRDNGTWGPNYSSMGGDLASAAISNLYFPRANRGAGLVFSQFAVGTAERVGASLAQEFLFARFTHRGGHVSKDPVH